METQKPITLGQFLKATFEWFQKNIPQVLFNIILAGIFGFLVNTYLLAFIYGGADVANSNSPVVGSGSFVQGSLFWTLGSMVFFMFFGYWRALGTSRFISTLAGIPNSLKGLFTVDGASARTHVLIGMALCLVTTSLISPWIAGVLAIGMFAFIPSVLGPIIGGLMKRAWSTITQSVIPADRQMGSEGMMVVLLGVALALTIAFFIVSLPIKIGIAFVCALLAFVFSQSQSRSAITTILITFTVANIFVLIWPDMVLADDGGWYEYCPPSKGDCSLGGWVMSPGASVLIGYGGLAGFGSAIFAGLGTSFGGAIGVLAASAPPVPPSAAAPGTDDRVLGGQEAIDELVRAGGKPDPDKPGCLTAESVDRIGFGGNVGGIAYSGTSVCPDGVAIIVEGTTPTMESGEESSGPDEDEASQVSGLAESEEILTSRPEEEDTLVIPEHEEGGSGGGLGPTDVFDEIRTEVLDEFSEFIPDSRMSNVYNSNVRVEDPSKFQESYDRYHGPDDPDRGKVPAYVERFEGSPPNIVVHATGASPGTLHHETVHLASNPDFKNQFGSGFGEAVTEYFTQKLTGPAGYDRSSISYNARGGTRLAEELVELVGEEALAEAYFGEGRAGINALEEAIENKTSPGTFGQMMSSLNQSRPDYSKARILLGRR